METVLKICGIGAGSGKMRLLESCSFSSSLLKDTELINVVCVCVLLGCLLSAEGIGTGSSPVEELDLMNLNYNLSRQLCFVTRMR